MVLFHGSDKIIEYPRFGYGRRDNDYGQGFYCTESYDLASEWAAVSDKGGIVNQYSLDIEDLTVLDLTSDDYSILNWLAILLSNRIVRLANPIENRGREYLLDNFNLDISSYDVITGYRADDSYFSFSRAFLSNTITYQQLKKAMSLGDLGIQFMLKSEKAFDSIKFDKFTYVSDTSYHLSRVSRDVSARMRYQQLLQDIDENGLYLSDFIRKEISFDELRLL